jgi:pSer/pThr/pTyr-binding forkhead associated (FHA) protein
VCRYDFVAGKAGPPPVGRPTPVPIPIPTPTPGWEIVISVDPSLDKEPDPSAPCPKDARESIVTLDRPEMLLGRHDDRRDIHPDVPLHDPGASRRHAKLVLADGGIALQDLASTNGTSVNGAEVASGSRTTLSDGDRVTLGRWTRITVRRRR